MGEWVGMGEEEGVEQQCGTAQASQMERFLAACLSRLPLCGNAMVTVLLCWTGAAHVHTPCESACMQDALRDIGKHSALILTGCALPPFTNSPHPSSLTNPHLTQKEKTRR